jgi:glutathione S-transferase
MYTLHIANKNYSSWSLRPWLLMRALAIAFDEQLTPFEDGSNRERFRRFSPNGKVPCLVDRDLAVWDSLAIAEYLAERHTGVWPTDAAARAWARCAAAEMHSGFAAMRERCSMSCGVRVRLHALAPEPAAELDRDLERLQELWTDGLTRFGGPYLAGPSFTAVDAFFAPIAFRVQTYGLVIEGAAGAYAARLLTLAPMRQWYEDALCEPWRDEPHDAQIRRAGVWLADLRARAG